MNTPQNSIVAKNIAELASRPMRLLEQLQVGCGYERSFKFTQEVIQANRFVLGVSTGDLTPGQWRDISAALEMPDEFRQPFFAALPRSSTVLIGFDLGAAGEPGYKLYLEFLGDMPARPAKGKSAAPFLLGTGYKWQADLPSRQLITQYECHPFLSSEEIMRRVNDCYNDMADPSSARPVMDVIKTAATAAGRKQFLFLQVSEPDSDRVSFDVNLYPSALRVDDVLPLLHRIAESFDVPMDQYRRLLPLIAGKTLGHVSAGLNSKGAPYFSLYYTAD